MIHDRIDAFIKDFVNTESGHFIVVSDDRLFSNVLRKTLVSELSLPASCISIINNESKIMRTVKEMGVRKKHVVVLIEAIMEYKRLDDYIRRINKRVRNAKMLVMTVESQLPYMALLREEGLAENWLTKPVVINHLMTKIVQVIMPPGQLEQLIQAAEDCIKNKSYRFALSTCRKIFELRPDSAVAYMIMGDAYRALDQTEDMIEAYEQAADLEEYYFDPLNRLVEYFEEKNDVENKLHYMERIAADSPYNIDRLLDIGSLQLQQGEDEEARDFFERSLAVARREELCPISDLALRIGDIYAKEKRDEAEEFYRMALESKGKLDLSDLGTFNNLGLSLRKQGRWKDAIKEYEKALKVDPRSEIIYYNMAMAYAEGGKIPNAFKCAEYSMKLDDKFYKTDAVICYNLGLIMSKASQIADARKLLDLSLSIKPDYASAKRLLAALPES